MGVHFSTSLKEFNSAPRIPFFSAALPNLGMPTIDQIYRDNLGLLIEEHGTAEALSAVIHKSPAQISQWLNGSKDSKTQKPRTMARATAREIERACGKPEGWMDRPHSDDETAELLDLFARLSGPGRIALTQSAQALLSAGLRREEMPIAAGDARIDSFRPESQPPSSKRRKKGE